MYRATLFQLRAGRMMRPRTCAIITLAVLLYLLLTIVFLWILHPRLTGWLEDITTVFFNPGLYAIAWWTPMLSPLGLVETNFLTFPSTAGACVAAAIDTALVSLLLGLLYLLIGVTPGRR